MTTAVAAKTKRLIAKLVPRPKCGVIPCLLGEDKRCAFFYQLRHLPLEEQALRVREEMKRNIGLTNTKEFVQWAVEFAAKLGDHDIVFEEETL